MQQLLKKENCIEQRTYYTIPILLKHYDHSMFLRTKQGIPFLLFIDEFVNTSIHGSRLALPRLNALTTLVGRLENAS